jgi:hypothetical protein
MAVPALDFKTMQVLSVTRCVSDKLESKVIYRNSAGVDAMLYFKCSNEEHDVLAEDFKNYLKADFVADI